MLEPLVICLFDMNCFSNLPSYIVLHVYQAYESKKWENGIWCEFWIT